MESTSQDTFTAWLTNRKRRLELPGIVVLAEMGDGAEYLCCLGNADVRAGTQISEQSLFRIASITKTFTALAILQLRDRGLLELDTPVREILPNFMSTVTDAPRITIRHLLTHTSGLPRDGKVGIWNTHVFPSREEFETFLTHVQPVFAPEVSFKYSNLGSSILGEIVSKTAGMNFDAYIREKIALPLALSNTFVGLPSPSAHQARGYGEWAGRAPRDEIPDIEACAMRSSFGMSSTARDLMRYLRFWTDPKSTAPILSERGYRDLLEPCVEPSGLDSGRALGWATDSIEGANIYKSYGWLPGFRSYICFSLEKGFRVVVLINAQDEDPEPIAKELVRVSLESSKQRSLDLVRFEGTFANEWGRVHIAAEEQRLKVSFLGLVRSTVIGYLIPRGPDTFLFESLTGYNFRGEDVTFEFDGSNVCALWGSTYTYRISDHETFSASGKPE